MKKYVPHITLTVIALAFLAGAGYLGVIAPGDHAAKHTGKAYNLAKCATLETNDLKICTTTPLIKKATATVVKCLGKHTSNTCGTQLYNAAMEACKKQGGKEAACTRDSVRIIAVIEAGLSGETVTKAIKPTGVSQR